MEERRTMGKLERRLAGRSGNSPLGVPLAPKLALLQVPVRLQTIVVFVLCARVGGYNKHRLQDRAMNQVKVGAHVQLELYVQYDQLLIT
jgi:hypothetical protein